MHYLASVTELLGGKKTLGREIKTQLDLVEISSRGVQKKSLQRLARYMGSSTSKMAALLPVTERTIQRYAPEDHFNRVVSEYILHIAEVMAKGTEVFGDKNAFMHWLAQPNTALGSRTPKSLLDSRFGTDMILDELGRIEHGVFS
jgi:putative toxin-antitoxin system antitoxin component (TIGR02293 family)